METTGPIVIPAAVCAPGIVTKLTQAVFVLSANLRCYPPDAEAQDWCVPIK